MVNDEILVTDISGRFGPEFMDGLLRELREVDAEKKAGYQLRQAEIARQTQEQGKVVLDGLGQKVATIDAYTFHSWGLAEGYGFWGDNAELDRFLQDNPECKAPGYWRGVRRKPSFHKNYGELK